MGYVAVKGGTKAIEASLALLAERRVDSDELLSVKAIEGGMKVLIDQIMSEGSFYDEKIAALAIKQAEGSPEEAVFLLRAYRSTLPRLHYTNETDTSKMWVERRISSSFKDIPGGQILGVSPDYSHRLLDFELLDEDEESIKRLRDVLLENASEKPIGVDLSALPKVVDYLRAEGLMHTPEPSSEEPKDITKQTLAFPTSRSERIQILARGQTGAIVAFGYAAQRGYGAVLHPTIAELRVGKIPLKVPNPSVETREIDDLDDEYYFGEIRLTEVETLIPVPVKRMDGKTEIEFALGYGVSFGRNETKTIAMSLLDYNLTDGDKNSPVGDEELILLHVDSVEASGFTSHLKLPHYVTFQSELDSVRKTRKSSFCAPKVGGAKDDLFLEGEKS